VVAPRFVIRPGHKYIVSVGSVGQPRDYDNRASYTIYDTEEKTFEFKRVAYDIESAANKIYDAELERNFGQPAVPGRVAEAEARERRMSEENRLAAILAHLDVAVFEVDREGVVQVSRGRRADALRLRRFARRSTRASRAT